MHAYLDLLRATLDKSECYVTIFFRFLECFCQASEGLLDTILNHSVVLKINHTLDLNYSVEH